MRQSGPFMEKKRVQRQEHPKGCNTSYQIHAPDLFSSTVQKQLSPKWTQSATFYPKLSNSACKFNMSFAQNQHEFCVVFKTRIPVLARSCAKFRGLLERASDRQAGISVCAGKGTFPEHAERAWLVSLVHASEQDGTLCAVSDILWRAV